MCVPADEQIHVAVIGNDPLAVQGFAVVLRQPGPRALSAFGIEDLVSSPREETYWQGQTARGVVIGVSRLAIRIDGQPLAHDLLQLFEW